MCPFVRLVRWHSLRLLPFSFFLSVSLFLSAWYPQVPFGELPRTPKGARLLSFRVTQLLCCARCAHSDGQILDHSRRYFHPLTLPWHELVSRELRYVPPRGARVLVSFFLLFWGGGRAVWSVGNLWLRMNPIAPVFFEDSEHRNPTSGP